MALLKESSRVACRFLSGVSRGELLKLHLAINVSGLVEPTELIYQFLYLIYCFLFFRCREKGFEEERNKNKDGNSRAVTTS